MSLTDKSLHRLETERNIWFTTVRPDGRPHMVPIWFAWYDGKLYGCIKPNSVKARNLANNSNVAISLEDGSSVVICEGTATSVSKPWPEGVLAILKQKYDWDISTSADYTILVEVTPQKWLTW